MQSANTLDTHDVLSAWQNHHSKSIWAMAIIVDCQGHSYRKRGAFTLINQEGEQLGVLSGGCLEADIRLMARKCLSLQKIMTKEYDGTDENDASYQMGCGGIVWIKFIPLNEHNNYLNLREVLHQLEQRENVIYGLDYNTQENSICSYVNSHHQAQLNVEIMPKVHLLICGGGKDATPVCDFAKQLGWQVSVWDPRAAYANKNDFINADTIIKLSHTKLGHYANTQKVNFSVLMSHSLELDALALASLANSDIKHIALLGPKKRFNEVVVKCALETSAIKPIISGPAGLDIGGELPTSIALSIVAKFHAIAFNKPS
ncbi:XdhC family protein [Pseudoalteromonas sp. MMG010]|uniref:XdhC family protein n=1 Tax=Pseudoalteromonas sp. MMG010 TaxID=2822685 RepID=UPI001B39FADD|nr:XdhC/CoxI family protein [Pseudoalteromonas sp. MMG010]MBQ4833928.1 XdhC family protein [Pseudoalteromonas sp. MMG010]